MTEGTLILVGKKKNLQVQFTNKNGKKVPHQIAESQLSKSLLDKKKNNIDELENMKVEFEEVGGQPQKVREKGKSWEQSSPQSPTTKPNKNRNNRNNKKPIIANKATATRKNTTIKGDFHNPYNFIPTPSRNSDENAKLGELGELDDRPAAGHGSYRHDYWSGRISVSLTTETPLLILDAANLEEKKQGQQKGHKVYDIRVNGDGKPNLPITSVKGMLRSAFEAITNSRYCIFEKHDEELVYRTPAEPNVKPARVERKNGELYLRIMKKLAKLKRYEKDKELNERDKEKKDKGEKRVGKKYKNTGKLPKHRDPVWVKINAKGKVLEIHKRDNDSLPDESKGWKKGWAYITGANIKEKNHERVFIENQNDLLIPISSDHDLAKLWNKLITNYQQEEFFQRNKKKRKEKGEKLTDYLGDEPGKPAWSRHIRKQDELELTEGTLCYVEFDNDKIIAIQPVMISRRFYSLPPNKLLDDSFKPPTKINELSPADRVFGWVNQQGKGSYKGNLRIFNLNCLTKDAIERYFCNDQNPDGFPLTILGQPQPQQARFYQAKDKQGNPLESGIAKKEGYSTKKQGLRGRKVYPHHNGLPEDYWNNPHEDRTTNPPENNNGYCQEYRQPGGENEKTDQNRSIKAWVKPQVEFTFTLDIINLSSVELGALLWLLSLPENHYHRLGGAKPLGFGSVSLKINWQETDLRNGQDWQQYYSSLFPLDSPQSYNREFFIDNKESCVHKFKQAVSLAYGNGNNFEQVSFISAFLRYTQGFDDKLPTYYPRLKAHRKADAEGFKWFEENERTGSNGGQKLSLPKLVKDRGLPFIISH